MENQNTILLLIGLAGLGVGAWYLFGREDEATDDNPMTATYTYQTPQGTYATATGYELQAMGYTLTPSGWVNNAVYQQAQQQGANNPSFNWGQFIQQVGGLVTVVQSSLNNWSQTQTNSLVITTEDPDSKPA